MTGGRHTALAGMAGEGLLEGKTLVQRLAC